MIESNLTHKHLLVIQKILADPASPDWLHYQSVYGCTDAAAKTSMSALKNRKAFKKIMTDHQENVKKSITKAINWTKDRLIREYSELAELAIEGDQYYDNKGRLTIKRDLSAAKGAFDSIGKIIGAFDVDNEQKKPVNNINLSDYFSKKSLE